MAAHPWLPWEEGKEEGEGGRASCGNNYSFLALPQSWVAGASRVPPDRVQGAERERVAGGGRGCGEHLPGFPATGAVREKAKISLLSH